MAPDPSMAWTLAYIAVISASVAVMLLVVVVIVPRLWREGRDELRALLARDPDPSAAAERRRLDALASTRVVPWHRK